MKLAFRTISITKRIKLHIDISDWVFPLALHYSCVGNRHRPYIFSIDVLCMRLIFCIDESSYESAMTNDIAE